MKKTIMCLIGVLCVTIIMGANDHWQRFDPKPMTVISPEEESLSNPPFFHWHKVENAQYYRIELRGLEVQKEWETEWNFFTPNEAFEEGFYSFTIAGYDTHGDIVKQTELQEFRVTDRSTGFEAQWGDSEYTGGTFHFIDDQQIENIQKANGLSGEYRDRILEAARNADVQEILELEEPATYEDDTWDRDQWNRINNASYRVDLFMQQQVMAYLLTSEDSFADNAIQAMNHIAQWDPTGSTGVWSSDHSAQSMMHALAIGYTALRDKMQPEEREVVKENIYHRSVDMYGFLNPFLPKETAAGMMNDPDNNHPWFCTVTLANGGMALMDEVSEASEWVSFAEQMFHGVFLPRGDSTGGWHEGIDYWSYMLYYVMQFAGNLNIVEGVDLFQHPWLQNTAMFKVVTHPPEGSYVPFGSCLHQTPNHFDQLVMIKLASVYQEPLMWKYIDSIDDTMHVNRLFFALLWYDRETVSNEVEIPPYHHFEDMGWVVAVSDVFDAEKQVLFAMKSGPFFGRRFNHSHGDQNHFVIAAGGDNLIWDAGYYDGYLADHHRHFTVQSIAHNVPLFDGEGQVVFTPGADGKITRYEFEDDRLIVQGDASKPVIYGGRAVKFIRTITMEDFRKFIIEDDIQADHLRQISWLLQSEYPIYYEQDTGNIHIKGDNYQVKGTFKTEESVDVILSDTFPVQPQRDERRKFPEQYRLELRTTEKIEFWEPVLKLEILSIDESGNE